MKSAFASVCCLGLILLAVFVSRNDSYSFDNHELNEMLRQELEDYKYQAEVDTRSKRDVGEEGTTASPTEEPHGPQHGDDDDRIICKHRHFKTCCGDETIMKKFLEKDKSFGRVCFRNVSATMDDLKDKTGRKYMGDHTDSFSCEGLKNLKMKIYCLNECIGKKKEFLKKDGSLNAVKLREFLNTPDSFKEEWQRELVTKGVDECLKKDFYKKTFPKEEYADIAGLDCSPTYVQFLSCLYKEIELGCPEQYQKNSKKCKAMREFYTNSKKRMIKLKN